MRKQIVLFISVLLIFNGFGMIAKGETVPRLIVGQATGTIGETVTVDVTIENNPGIIYGTLKIEYDNTCLICKSAVLNSDFAFGANQTYKEPYFTFYLSKDNYKNGVLLILTFDIIETAKAGDAEVSVSYEKGNITNYNEEDIEPGIVSGKITVIRESEYIPGDINGDDKVNNKDLTRLFQYLSNWDVTVNEAALDVNGDGKVNNKDLTRLFQYLSNWDVSIF